MLSTTTAIIHWDEPEEANGQVVGYRVYYTADSTLQVNQVSVCVCECVCVGGGPERVCVCGWGDIGCVCMCGILTPIISFRCFTNL